MDPGFQPPERVLAERQQPEAGLVQVIPYTHGSALMNLRLLNRILAVDCLIAHAAFMKRPNIRCWSQCSFLLPWLKRVRTVRPSDRHLCFPDILNCSHGVPCWQWLLGAVPFLLSSLFGHIHLDMIKQWEVITGWRNACGTFSVPWVYP